jgi:hypothetical protein
VTPRDMEVELPGQAAFVRMARLVVAGFATASSGLDDARLGGLRMAVAEACESAIGSRDDVHGDDPLRLRVRMEGDTLHVWIEDPAGGIHGHDLLLAELLVSEMGVEPVVAGGNAAHFTFDHAGPAQPVEGPQSAG